MLCYGRSPARALEIQPGDIVGIDRRADKVVHIDPQTGIRSPIAEVEGLLSVLVEPSHTILVGLEADPSGQSTILRIDPADGSISDPLQGRFSAAASGMALDADGRLLVATVGVSGVHAISRVDLDHGAVAIVSVSGELSHPGSIAVQKSGAIVWADATAHGTVLLVDPLTGARSVLASGGMLFYPLVATGPHDEIYATSGIDDPDSVVYQGRVLAIDPLSGSQTSIAAYGYLWDPLALAVELDGSILVSTLPPSSSESVVRVDPTSGAQSVVSETPDGPSLLNGITVVPEPGESPSPPPIEVTVGDLYGVGCCDHVVHIDRETGKRTQVSIGEPPGFSASALLAEPSGTLWVGGSAVPHANRSSVIRVDPRTGTFTDPLAGAFTSEVSDIAVDGAGRLLVASAEEGALFRITPASGEIETIAQGGFLTGVRSIAVEPSGAVVATSWVDPAKIVRIDPDSGDQLVASADGVSTFSNGIAVAGDGLIYATALLPDATFDGQLVRIDPQTGAQSVVSAGDFITDTYSLELDLDGSLLVSTGYSASYPQDKVLRVDPQTGAQSAPSVGRNQAPLWRVSVLPEFGCPFAPAVACKAATRSRVNIKAAAGGDDGKLIWKWLRGQTASEDFTDPQETVYAVCGYLDGIKVIEGRIEPGALCAGRPCWKTTGGRLQYRNRHGNEHGIAKVKLRPGVGNASVQVVAAGQNLTLPGLPLDAELGLTLQLIHSGDSVCWESEFSTLRRNDDRQVKATQS